MSEQIPFLENATENQVPMQNNETSVEAPEKTAEVSSEYPNETTVTPVADLPAQIDDPCGLDPTPMDFPSLETSIQSGPSKPNIPLLETKLEVIKEEVDDILTEEKHLDPDIKQEIDDFAEDQISADIKNEIAGLIEDLEDDKRGIKRRMSAAFSDDGDVEFLGFEDIKQESVVMEYSQILERLEAEVSAASLAFTPVRYVMATPRAPTRASKRLRTDTDGSRPSSAQSSRSEDDNPSASPAHRGRRSTVEISSPLLRVPLERGWKRELVFRAALDAYSRRNADIYYYTPAGKKLRSTREVSENLSGTGLTLDNFSFFKEPLGINDPEREIIRDAKVMRRVESPISSPAPVESKRVPKPKAPRTASPEPTPKSPPTKLKVKSVGSRLTVSPAASTKDRQKKPSPTPPPPPPAAPTTDNNNTAAWKKPSSEITTRTRMANGAPTTVAVAAVAGTPRRRGRPRTDDTDHFTAFYNKALNDKSNVAIQIFQYLGMRDLANCARVSKLWKQLAATPALWRHVRMKNSHVSDWGGLCAALKRHGSKWLDLRKMLLPQNDTVFWEQFAKHIATVESLERLELCRCPASAVESSARSLPGLRALSALAIRDASLDPGPLGNASQLRELRLKSLAGLALSADLTALAPLQHLQHLSLTSIKELGWHACDVIGTLSNLESLELGECTFRAEFGGVLGKLTRLRRLRLERGTAHCAAPALLRALARLPALTRLELVNVDVKIGFDDALAECKNIQRLLIIPTYVSQSATTNKQVLSGVLRLKETLTHLMWGVTIELLRVTELFIDQCSAGGGARRELGECIPVLKPVPGCRLPMDHQLLSGPPQQVEILPLPTLQRLLSSQLPHTKLKLLRIPFHATWRQSLADFQ